MDSESPVPSVVEPCDSQSVIIDLLRTPDYAQSPPISWGSNGLSLKGQCWVDLARQEDLRFVGSSLGGPILADAPAFRSRVASTIHCPGRSRYFRYNSRITHGIGEVNPNTVADDAPVRSLSAQPCPLCRRLRAMPRLKTVSCSRCESCLENEQT